MMPLNVEHLEARRLLASPELDLTFGEGVRKIPLWGRCARLEARVKILIVERIKGVRKVFRRKNILTPLRTPRLAKNHGAVIMIVETKRWRTRMRAANHRCGGMYVQALEPRRLLSLTPAGPETMVPISGSITDFDVAVAGNGSYIIASSTTRKDGTSIVATRHVASGRQIGEPVTLASGLGKSGGVSISMDADGDAVVAYAVDYSRGERIFFTRISRNGVISAPVLAANDSHGTDSDDRIGSPTISMDAAGNFFLAYIHTLTRCHNDVQMRVYDAAGKLRGAEFTAEEIFAPFPDVNGFDLAAKKDGSGAVFIYSFVHSDDMAQSLFVGRASTTARIGEADLLARLVGPAVSGFTGNPPTLSVAVNADGSFLASYDSEHTLTFVQRYDAAGKTRGKKIQLEASLPALASLPDGGFALSAGGFVRRYNASGVADPTGVVAAGGSGIYSRIGADNLGEIVLVYEKTSGGPVFSRRLQAGFANLVKSELYVLGTDDADTIRVARDGGRIVVYRGDSFKTFDAAKVKGMSINGFDGNDSIFNDTNIPSTLVGSRGDDTLRGGAGGDFIRGESNNDSLSGGDGNDTLLGEGGNDSLSGNAGRDFLDGGAGNDRLSGHGGRDKLFGSDGNDRLYGGASDDWLYGQAGDDQLFGEGGNDELHADSGRNTLHGGASNDLLISNNGTIDSLFGDGGRDSAKRDDADVFDSVEARA